MVDEGRRAWTRARLAVGISLVSGLVVVSSAVPLAAAEPEPVFHMPFPRGETWAVSSRDSHATDAGIEQVGHRLEPLQC